MADTDEISQELTDLEECGEILQAFSDDCALTATAADSKISAASKVTLMSGYNRRVNVMAGVILEKIQLIQGLIQAVDGLGGAKDD